MELVAAVVEASDGVAGVFLLLEVAEGLAELLRINHLHGRAHLVRQVNRQLVKALALALKEVRVLRLQPVQDVHCVTVGVGQALSLEGEVVCVSGVGSELLGFGGATDLVHVGREGSGVDGALLHARELLLN